AARAPALWAQRYGGAGGDEAAALAIAPGGDIVIAGQLSGTVSVGPESLTSMGASDAFVARLSPAGQVLWARSLGGAGVDLATAVAVDPDGTTIVLGTFQRRMALAGSVLEARGL